MHLDNAGSALAPTCVLDRAIAHLHERALALARAAEPEPLLEALTVVDGSEATGPMAHVSPAGIPGVTTDRDRRRAREHATSGVVPPRHRWDPSP